MLKAELARGYATVATEICFAIPQMDFSQAETGLLISAMPYMYGAPNPKLKSALVQVEHGPWLKAQRDKGTAYKAIKRLVTRQVFRQTSKGRYILNTRYGEWLDKQGVPVFTEGSQALANLQTLLAIRPYWRTTDAGQNIPGVVDNPPADPSNEVGTHPPAAAESGHTPTGKSGHTPTKSGHTPTEQVGTHPPESGHTPTTAPRNPAISSTPEGVANSRLLLSREKQQARTLAPALRDFAAAVCLLGESGLAELENFAGTFTDAELIPALERLANSPTRPDNPVGFVRSIAESARNGGTITLPRNARTFAEYARRWQTAQNLREALNGKKQPTSANMGDPAARLDAIDKAAQEAAQMGDSRGKAVAGAVAAIREENDRKAAKLAELEADALAFTQRPPMQQQGVIEMARSHKRLWPMIQTAEAWIEGGRPPLDAPGNPAKLAVDLAILEQDGRRFFDSAPEIEGAEIETVAARAP